jgi:hypothetical protein
MIAQPSLRHTVILALSFALVLPAAGFTPLSSGGTSLTRRLRGIPPLKMGVVEPAKVHAMREANPSLPYVDVRTPDEFSKARVSLKAPYQCTSTHPHAGTTREQEILWSRLSPRSFFLTCFPHLHGEGADGFELYLLVRFVLARAD